MALRPMESVHHLVGCPLWLGVLRHVEADDAPLMVGRDDEHKHHLACHRGHHEEIEGHQGDDMVLQECPPRGGWRFPEPNPVLLDRGLRHVNAEFAEFPHEAWCTPGGVGL